MTFNGLSIAQMISPRCRDELGNHKIILKDLTIDVIPVKFSYSAVISWKQKQKDAYMDKIKIMK